ncbi:MAG: vWA domain-containing protein [bacterium]
MKKYLLYLCLLCCILMMNVSCEAPQKQSRNKKKEINREIDLAKIKRIDIPIDESLVTSEASLTRNFYFIFDGSGSMQDAPGGACRGDQRFGSKLEGAKWAVQEFMKKVPDTINIALYVFDTYYGRREVVPLGTNNRQEFIRAVNTIRPGGMTPLADAIKFATDQLVSQYKKQLGYGEYRIVVITDGIAEDIPEAVIYSAKRGMPIYAIGLCIGDDHPLRRYALSYRAADNFADLAKGLEETLAESEVFDPTEFKF